MTFIFSDDSGIEPIFICPNCGFETSHKGNILYSKTNYTPIKVTEDKVSEEIWRIIYFKCNSCQGESFWMEFYKTLDTNASKSQCIWTGKEKPIKILPVPNSMTKTTSSIITKQILLYPEKAVGIPIPNSDLSDEVKSIYNEAASISDKSPRAAAALLRLALETFLKKDLNIQGKSINDRINKLYNNGIPENIEQIMDIVRIAGNDAIHDGNIAIIDTEGKDDLETVKNLFQFINYLAKAKISLSKMLNQITNNFSDGQKKTIERRHNSFNK